MILWMDPTLVKGSHGAVNAGKAFHPVFISDVPFSREELEAADVHDLIWKSLFE